MDEISKKRRLFIALNPPEEIKEELSKTLDKLKDNVKGVKWVKPDGFHLTLHFLGYMNETQIEKVLARMNKFAGKFGLLNFRAGELGAFPTLISPRVIFLDCPQINGDSVYKLQKELGEKLEEIGIETDKRPWQAHLTLGRVKGKLSQTIHSISQKIKFKNKNFIIDSFELMESKLKPDGAEYKVVMSYKL